MGSTASTEKPNAIISANEVERLKTEEDLRLSKQTMESFDEENLMKKLKACIVSEYGKSGFRPHYDLYPSTIARLRAAGYTVSCSTQKPNSFGQQCTIYWGDKTKQDCLNVCHDG